MKTKYNIVYKYVNATEWNKLEEDLRKLGLEVKNE